MRYSLYVLLCSLLVSNTYAETQQINVNVTAPTSGYSLTITDVHDINGALFVLAEIKPPSPNQLLLQVISTLTDACTVESNSVTQNIFIIHNRPFKNQENGYRYIQARRQFESALLEATKLTQTNINKGDSHVK